MTIFSSILFAQYEIDLSALLRQLVDVFWFSTMSLRVMPMLLITALDLHTIFTTPSSAVARSSATSSGLVGDAMNVAIDSSIVPGRAVELGAM